MKYMLLIYSDEAAWTEEERQQCFADSTELTQQLDTEGKYVSAAPLHSVAVATSVRIRDGRMHVIDGPFAETKEVIGGYAVFEVSSREEALELGRNFMQLHLDHMPGWEGVMEMRQIAGSQTKPMS